MTNKTYSQDSYEKTEWRERDYQAYELTGDNKSARRIVTGSPAIASLDDANRVKNSPTITNYNISDNNEHAHLLQNNVKSFTLRCRNNLTRIQISYVAGNTNTIFFTNGMGGIYREENIRLPSNTSIYFRLLGPVGIVEVLEWT